MDNHKHIKKEKCNMASKKKSVKKTTAKKTTAKKSTAKKTASKKTTAKKGPTQVKTVDSSVHVTDQNVVVVDAVTSTK